METKDLIANLHEWHENLISEMCADDVLTCDDLCGYPGPCIVIQAANLLEAQQKRIAELEAALREQEERRWIPVTERLPEKTGTYFVVTKTGAVTFARFYPEHDFIDCTGKFIRHEKGNFQTNRNVIYWMPLPEPPKGE